MFSNASGVLIQGGTFNNSNTTNRTSRGMDLLMEWVATGAFHNSKELYDSPKCHPHTRVAVLDNIMQWVISESESRQEDFILWLFGPAGAGKSAIAKRIAEMAAEMDMLIATFFFSRTSPTRRTEDRLIATLAYQLAVSIPDTRTHIEDAIERDPVIFHKTILTQIDALLLKPLQSVLSTQIIPSQKLIIIDGLDECNDSQAQVAILEAISHTFIQHDLPIKFLVVSRPEISLVTLFTSQEPLKSIHRRLALDDTYRPNDDIRLFFSDKFEHIRLTHPLRSTIPISWPTQEILETLVAKSSGQFIYASTVVKFVESNSHRPIARLNIILGISPPGRMNPFAELDALYNHLLSSVDDIELTLRVLSLYVLTPNFASGLATSISAEHFLSLEPGDIQFALMNLSSILAYHESSGLVEILHASLVDFLSDRRRSTTFYIDMASTCIDFVRRILQYIKGPDGIRAGNIDLFSRVIDLCPWIPEGQLRSDILNFDLDGFISASIRWQYKGPIEYPVMVRGSTINTFWIWKKFFDNAHLEDSDTKEALDLLNRSLKSRMQIYQPHLQLTLLILLEMDDHNLHLLDQDALDLRHAYMTPLPRLIGMISRYVDGNTYASAALHCMRFISSPPKYSERNECPEMGLIYTEWKATCALTLEMLCKLLRQANTSLELVKFIRHHDIHPAVQKKFSVDHVWQINVHILAFLSRASVCVNWRIISAIQRSLFENDYSLSKLDANDARHDEEEGPETIQNLNRQHLDQCCMNVHTTYI